MSGFARVWDGYLWALGTRPVLAITALSFGYWLGNGSDERTLFSAACGFVGACMVHLGQHMQQRPAPAIKETVEWLPEEGSDD